MPLFLSASKNTLNFSLSKLVFIMILANKRTPAINILEHIKTFVKNKIFRQQSI